MSGYSNRILDDLLHSRGEAGASCEAYRTGVLVEVVRERKHEIRSTAPPARETPVLVPTRECSAPEGPPGGPVAGDQASGTSSSSVVMSTAPPPFGGLAGD